MASFREKYTVSTTRLSVDREPEPDRRYREWREEQAAERARVEAERLDLLFSCWSCACVARCGSLAGYRCADHGGPCQPGEIQSLRSGVNERNPAGASLIAMAAIRKAFPDQATEIISTLRWHGSDLFWSFVRWDHFVGVERDGEIHT